MSRDAPLQSAAGSALDWIQRDNEIATSAKQRLAADPWLPSAAVNVKVEHGWITLTGYVRWYHQKAAARQDVVRVNGALGVTNLVTIEPAADEFDVIDMKPSTSQRSWLSEDHVIVASSNDDDMQELQDAWADALAIPDRRER